MANFCARIAEAAATYRDRPAIEVVRADRLETTTYAELMAESARIAGWLERQGLVAGDRVAILADNDARWIGGYLGVLRAGLVAVPLDTAYTASQVDTVLRDSGARLLFTTPKFLDAARAAQLSAPDTWDIVLLAGQSDGCAGPDDLASATPTITIVDVPDTESAVILYTSGTTSDPKGVVLTHGNLIAEQHAAFQVVHVTERHAVLGVLPLFHALAQMANLLLPLSVGARVVFLETINSATLLAALQSRGITIFACVPQFFYLIHQRVMAEVAKGGLPARLAFRTLVRLNGWLRDRIGWNPGRLVFGRIHRMLGPQMQVLVTGGSRFDPAIGRDLYGLGLTLLNAYGLTETSGGATLVRPRDRFTTSVGQPFPGVDVKILDDEVLIRGSIVMREYYRRPEATAEALRDGWLHTGDLGRLDEAGRLYITGRRKEVIVLSSGKNLYPEELEAHYRQSTYFKDVCVLGLARTGQPAAERLHAVIVPDEDVRRARGIVNLREMARFELEGLSVQLPAHKRVLSFDVWLDPLPRTTTGKIKRHEVERLVHERAAAAEAQPNRALTADEQAWLATAGHQEATDVIGAQLDRAIVRPDDNLELDLGLDSMERVELLTALERRQGTRVAPAARSHIFTVRELVDAVVSAPASTRPADAVEADFPWDALLGEPPDPALVDNLARRKPVRAVLLFVLFRLASVPARLFFGFRARGHEHLPAQGAFIICPNHQTYFDGLLLAASLPFGVFRRLFLVGAAEYFTHPWMASLARAINIVSVDPNANLVTAMRAGASGLRMGKVLVLFPEGERSIDGALKPFRKGAAILSSHLDTPIIPVAIDGLYPLWPRGKSFQWRLALPWRAQRVTYRFGAPVRVARGAYHDGTAALRTAVERLIVEIRD